MPTATQTARRLRTIPETADELRVKEKTVRAWIWRRQIDTVRVGRCVRIPQGAIDKLIERGTVPALER